MDRICRNSFFHRRLCLSCFNGIGFVSHIWPAHRLTTTAFQVCLRRWPQARVPELGSFCTIRPPTGYRLPPFGFVWHDPFSHTTAMLPALGSVNVGLQTDLVQRRWDAEGGRSMLFLLSAPPCLGASVIHLRPHPAALLGLPARYPSRRPTPAHARLAGDVGSIVNHRP
jgi:hypothetical protein